MNKKTVLVSGGDLEESFVLPILKSEDTEFVIGVDRGIQFLYDHKIRPDYIIGDFDSAPKEIVRYFKEDLNVPSRELDQEKDISDTDSALSFCFDLNRRHIVLLGAIGSRVDHVWANVQCMAKALKYGVEVAMMDSHNRIRLFDRDFALRKKEAFGRYFSLFPLGGTIEGVSISGAKYPLDHHILSPFDSLCVSNEFAEDQVLITVPYGIVILMETRD